MKYRNVTVTFDDKEFSLSVDGETVFVGEEEITKDQASELNDLIGNAISLSNKGNDLFKQANTMFQNAFGSSFSDSDDEFDCEFYEELQELLKPYLE